MRATGEAACCSTAIEHMCEEQVVLLPLKYWTPVSNGTYKYNPYGY